MRDFFQIQGFCLALNCSLFIFSAELSFFSFERGVSGQYKAVFVSRTESCCCTSSTWRQTNQRRNHPKEPLKTAGVLADTSRIRVKASNVVVGKNNHPAAQLTFYVWQVTLVSLTDV